MVMNGGNGVNGSFCLLLYNAYLHALIICLTPGDDGLALQRASVCRYGCRVSVLNQRERVKA